MPGKNRVQLVIFLQTVVLRAIPKVSSAATLWASFFSVSTSQLQQEQFEEKTYGIENPSRFIH
jgi:hypothetical protein